MSVQRDFAIIPGFRSDRKALSWRALGQVEDLDLNFAERDRPGLVTAVLTTCAEPSLSSDGETDIWRLSLAARIGGLLAIYAATSGAESLSLTPRCPAPDCREPMEVNLPLEALMAMAREAETEPEIQVERPQGAPLRLRRPTGADQRLWRGARYADGDAAEATVLASLVVDGELDANDAAVIAEALQAFDPLSCFEIDVTCPSCEKQSDIPVDLEAALLGALGRAQKRMIGEVDRLARRYGWGEAEILAIPPWRRRRYLALDGDGWSA